MKREKIMDLQITKLPLELNSYFFPECNINFSPLENEGEKFSVPGNINITTSAGKNKDHPELWEISVRVQTVTGNEEKKFNLEFNVCALGFFKNTDRKEENELMDHMIRLHGSAILLGAIRERIAVATGTSPFGPFFLPSLGMRIVDNDIPKEKKNKTKK